MTEFVGQFVAQYNVRPRRIAYLVQSTNGTQVLKAMRYAASEWGGITQPIIPVTPRRGMATGYRDLSKILQPEVIIDYAGAPTRVRHELESTSGAQIVDEARLEHWEPGIHVLAAVPLEAGTGRHMELPADPASLTQTAILGSIWEAQEEDWRKAGFVPSRLTDPLAMFCAQLRSSAQIELTRSQLPIFEIGGGMPGVIVFCLTRPTLNDLVWFWNIRALSAPDLGRHVFLTNPSVLRVPKAAAHLREFALQKGITTPDLVLLGRDSDQLRQLGQEAGFTPMPKDARLTWGFADTRERNLADKPLSFAVNLNPGLFLGGQRMTGMQGQQSIAMTAPQTNLYISAPARFRRGFNGYVRLEFRGIEPFEWPHEPSVARLIHNDASYSSYGLGFVTMSADRYHFLLRSPQEAEVLGAILSDRGWSWKVSDKGRYAQALENSLSGIEAIGAIGSTLAVRVIRSLMSLSRKKAEQAIRGAIRSRIEEAQLSEVISRLMPTLVPQWKSLEEIASDVKGRKNEVLRVLEELVDERLTLRGFRFNCPTCGMTTSVLLGRESDRMACDGCGTRNVLRGPTNREPVIVYGLNTLLDRVMDQDCLGHLLTKRWITRLGRATWVVPGADVLSQGSGDPREVDVLGLSHSELLVGEVKNSAGAFSTSDR